MSPELHSDGADPSQDPTSAAPRSPPSLLDRLYTPAQGRLVAQAAAAAAAAGTLHPTGLPHSGRIAQSTAAAPAFHTHPTPSHPPACRLAVEPSRDARLPLGLSSGPSSRVYPGVHPAAALESDDTPERCSRQPVAGVHSSAPASCRALGGAVPVRHPAHTTFSARHPARAGAACAPQQRIHGGRGEGVGQGSPAAPTRAVRETGGDPAGAPRPDPGPHRRRFAGLDATAITQRDDPGAVAAHDAAGSYASPRTHGGGNLRGQHMHDGGNVATGTPPCSHGSSLTLRRSMASAVMVTEDLGGAGAWTGARGDACPDMPAANPRQSAVDARGPESVTGVRGLHGRCWSVGGSGVVGVPNVADRVWCGHAPRGTCQEAARRALEPLRARTGNAGAVEGEPGCGRPRERDVAPSVTEWEFPPEATTAADVYGCTRQAHEPSEARTPGDLAHAAAATAEIGARTTDSTDGHACGLVPGDEFVAVCVPSVAGVLCAADAGLHAHAGVYGAATQGRRGRPAGSASTRVSRGSSGTLSLRRVVSLGQQAAATWDRSSQREALAEAAGGTRAHGGGQRLGRGSSSLALAAGDVQEKGGRVGKGAAGQISRRGAVKGRVKTGRGAAKKALSMVAMFEGNAEMKARMEGIRKLQEETVAAESKSGRTRRTRR